MDSFTKHTGVVTPLDRMNVDTDAICPAEYLKRIERTGYGEFLFNAWRKDEGFVLNHPVYSKGTVLVSGRNFGSGSSREHAVWAILQYGFRAVIAPNFADIFHNNSFENGLCPVILPEDQVNQIMEKAKAKPGYQVTVDLQDCEVSDDDGLRFEFVIHQDPNTHEFRRHCLLNGLDSIALTLQHEDKIAAFERRRAEQAAV